MVDWYGETSAELSVADRPQVCVCWEGEADCQVWGWDHAGGKEAAPRGGAIDEAGRGLWVGRAGGKDRAPSECCDAVPAGVRRVGG